MHSLMLWAAIGSQLATPGPAPSRGVDLEADTRLAVRASLSVKSKPVAACLEALGKETGLRLIAAEAVAQRRATVFAERRPLRQLMAALARVAGLSWRAAGTGTPPAGYELYQTNDARDREAREKAASERREEQGRRLKEEALLRAVDRAIAERDPGQPGVADLLEGLSPDERRQAAELAEVPIGLTSASDQSHLHNHLIFATPVERLAPALRDAVAGMLDRPNYSPGGSGMWLAPALDDPAQLSRSYVGLVAADGGLSLGIVGPDGKDVWVSPLDRVARTGIPGYTSDNSMEPEVVEALSQRPWLDLSTLPRAERERQVRFPRSLSRTSLPDILQSLSEQTHLAFIADDYARSRKCVFPWLLTDREAYTLNEALSQIAGAFGHRFTYGHGAVLGMTASPGLDLRCEPPGDLVAYLVEKSAKGGAMTLEDYLRVAKLPVPQFTTLLLDSVPAVQGRLGLYRVQRLYGVLHFMAGLRPEQRAQAESKEGLPVRDMDLRQQQAFRRIANVGLPQRASAEAPAGHAGFRVQTRKAGDAVAYTLLVVSERTPPLTAAFSVSVPLAGLASDGGR